MFEIRKSAHGVSCSDARDHLRMRFEVLEVLLSSLDRRQPRSLQPSAELTIPGSPKSIAARSKVLHLTHASAIMGLISVVISVVVRMWGLCRCHRTAFYGASRSKRYGKRIANCRYRNLAAS